MFPAPRPPLRVRPGHLANFSGGAGYLPFVWFLFALPASLLSMVTSTIVLFLVARSFRQGDEGNLRNGRFDFAALLKYARIHLALCAAAAAGLGAWLFWQGMESTYASGYAAAAVLLCVGPIIAWLVSHAAMIWMIYRRGPGGGAIAAAFLIYVLLLAGVSVAGLAFC